jgi:PAS domain S-box-containing protein
MSSAKTLAPIFPANWLKHPYVRIIGFGLAYYLAVNLGLILVTQPEGISVIWPASGVALAALLLSSRREWVPILAVIFGINLFSNLLTSHVSLPISAGFALANTLEPALGSWLMNYWLGEKITFTRLVDIVSLVVVAASVNGFTAMIGALIPTLAFNASYSITWLSWWVLDGMSILIITPFLVIWWHEWRNFPRDFWTRKFETIVWMVILIATTWYMFDAERLDIYLDQNPYMLFPILAWVALRFSPRVSASALVLTGIIALYSAIFATGSFPMGGATARQNLISIQAFLFIASATTMMLSTVFTERKRAEDELWRINTLMNMIVENIPNMIFLKEAGELRFVQFNRAGEALLDYSRDELLGKNDYDFFPKEQADFFTKKDRDALRGNEVVDIPEELLQTRNKGTRILHTKKVPLFGVDGKAEYLLGISEDITERKRAEEEIRQLNANLEQRVEERTRELRGAQEQLVQQEKLAILGQVAGSMGHELRNPLGVISNAVYFLKMVQTDAPEKIKEYLNTIERETRASEKILTDLLDFVRVESVRRGSVAVADLIRQTLERFPAPESVQVELDLPAGLPGAYADSQQIVQVLGNLVLNAYQAMPHGGKLLVLSRVEGSVISNQSPITAPLTTASPITDHWILITVKDTGIGIPPENMEKLFEPLFTTRTKGIGLGLAVSKKLIEANGGRIEVQSEPGKGSTFTVWLPLFKPERGKDDEPN